MQCGQKKNSKCETNLSKLWEIVETKEPGVLQSMGSQRVEHDLPTEQQQNVLLMSLTF